MTKSLNNWSDAIPDLMGTILAARAWCFFDGRLFPIYSGGESKWATYGMWWKIDSLELPGKAWGDPGVQTADCRMPTEMRHLEGEPPPAKGCLCGFWGIVEPQHLAEILGLPSPLEGESRKLLDAPAANWPLRRRTSSFVLGVVRMWGKVIPGEAGWRSSKAQIAGIIATSHPHARKIARRYRVPILSAWPELTPAWETA